MSSSLRSFHIYLYGAFLCIKESVETVVVSVRSLLFDKGEYIMKLSQKKWKSLISGVLLAASASSFLIAPVYAADYSKPLIGTLKKDSEILSPDGNTCLLYTSDAADE